MYATSIETANGNQYDVVFDSEATFEEFLTSTVDIVQVF
jgi:hypothetical protein